MRLALSLAVVLLAVGSSAASGQDSDDDEVDPVVAAHWARVKAHCQPLRADKPKYNACESLAIHTENCKQQNTDKAKIEVCVDERLHPEKYGKESFYRSIHRMAGAFVAQGGANIAKARADSTAAAAKAAPSAYTPTVTQPTVPPAPAYSVAPAAAPVASVPPVSGPTTGPWGPSGYMKANAEAMRGIWDYTITAGAKTVRGKMVITDGTHAAEHIGDSANYMTALIPSRGVRSAAIWHVYYAGYNLVHLEIDTRPRRWTEHIELTFSPDKRTLSGAFQLDSTGTAVSVFIGTKR